jgi:hypothetical protein
LLNVPEHFWGGFGDLSERWFDGAADACAGFDGMLEFRGGFVLPNSDEVEQT